MANIRAPSQAYPNINTQNITDLFVRSNFVELGKFLTKENQFTGWKHITGTLTGETENSLIQHGLGYIPKEFILTRIGGPGKLTVNFDDFDGTNISVSSDDTVSFSAYVGTYQADLMTPSTIQGVQEFQALVPTPGSASAIAGEDGEDGQTITEIITGEFVAPTVQKFTSGSGTYILPSTPRVPAYIRVRMVGGGGGGSGSGSGFGGASSGTSGADTTFGSSYLTAGGGSGGVYASTASPGGAVTIPGGLVGVGIAGATGSVGTYTAANQVFPSGAGGSTAFGGAGGGAYNATGRAGEPNSGSGGSGGGAPAAAGLGGGAGGSAGGYIDVIIPSPSASYTYSVGAGGTGGAGTHNTGGAGGSGVIIVEEFYQ